MRVMRCKRCQNRPVPPIPGTAFERPLTSIPARNSEGTRQPPVSVQDSFVEKCAFVRVHGSHVSFFCFDDGNPAHGNWPSNPNGSLYGRHMRSNLVASSGSCPLRRRSTISPNTRSGPGESLRLPNGGRVLNRKRGAGSPSFRMRWIISGKNPKFPACVPPFWSA